MTDRELLELAAKAADVLLPAGEVTVVCTDEGWGSWNPLADDGDAIRLAVKLELSVNAYSSYVIVADQHADFDGRDRMSVVRKTIVRAAAALGEGRG